MPASLSHPTPNRRLAANDLTTSSRIPTNSHAVRHESAFIGRNDPDRLVILILLVGLAGLLAVLTGLLGYVVFFG